MSSELKFQEQSEAGAVQVSEFIFWVRTEGKRRKKKTLAELARIESR